MGEKLCEMVRKHQKLVSIGALALFCLFVILSSAQAGFLIDRVVGRILLQVEEHGEAWYVYPEDKKHYYLGRPADAFQIMREHGLRIANKDLAQIARAQTTLSPPVTTPAPQPAPSPTPAPTK